MKLIKILIRIASILLVFAFPIGHLLLNYGITKTTVTTTEISFNPLVMLVVVALVLAFLLWIAQGLLIQWWEDIKKHPFGSKSVITFSVLIVVLLGGMALFSYGVAYVVETNAQSIVDNFHLYMKDFAIACAYAFVGGILNILHIFIK